MTGRNGRGAAGQVLPSTAGRDSLEQGLEGSVSQRERKSSFASYATARPASGRYGGSQLSQSMDFSQGIKLAGLQHKDASLTSTTKDTKSTAAQNWQGAGRYSSNRKEAGIDPRALLARNSSSACFVRQPSAGDTQKNSKSSAAASGATGAAQRLSEAGDAVVSVSVLAAPAVPRSRIGSTGGKPDSDERLQRLQRESDKLRELHGCMEEQLDQLRDKLMSAEANNISLQQSSASLQLEQSALQAAHQQLTQQHESTLEQLRETQAELQVCRERMNAASTTSEIYTRALSQAMCTLGSLSQGVSVPLEAAAEEIQATQHKLMEVQAQLQVQAAEHHEHLKWRFAEEEELRQESEELRRRTQETEDLVGNLRLQLKEATEQLEQAQQLLGRQEAAAQTWEAERTAAQVERLRLETLVEEAKAAAVAGEQHAKEAAKRHEEGLAAACKERLELEARVKEAVAAAEAAEGRAGEAVRRYEEAVAGAARNVAAAEAAAEGWKAKSEEMRRWAEVVEGEASRLELSCRAAESRAESARQEAEAARQEAESARCDAEEAIWEAEAAREAGTDVKQARWRAEEAELEEEIARGAVDAANVMIAELHARVVAAEAVGAEVEAARQESKVARGDAEAAKAMAVELGARVAAAEAAEAEARVRVRLATEAAERDAIRCKEAREEARLARGEGERLAAEAARAAERSEAFRAEAMASREEMERRATEADRREAELQRALAVRAVALTNIGSQAAPDQSDASVGTSVVRPGVEAGVQAGDAASMQKAVHGAEQMQQLKQQLEGVRRQLGELEAEKGAWGSECQVLREEREGWQRERDALLGRVASGAAAAAEVGERLKDAERSAEEALAGARDAEARMLQAEAEAAEAAREARKEVEEARAAVLAAEGEVARARAAAGEAEREVKLAKAAAEGAARMAEREVEEAKAAAAAAGKEAERELVGAKAAAAAAQADASSRQAEVELLQQALKDRRVELAAARRQLDALTGERLQQEREHAGAARAAEGRAEAEISELRTKLEALQAEVSEARERGEREGRAAGEARAAVAAEREGQEAAVARRDAAEGEVERLKEQLRVVEGGLLAAKGAAEAAQGRCAALQLELEGMKAGAIGERGAGVGAGLSDVPQGGTPKAKAPRGLTEGSAGEEVSPGQPLKRRKPEAGAQGGPGDPPSTGEAPGTPGEGFSFAPRQVCMGAGSASPKLPQVSPHRMPPGGSFKHLCNAELAVLLGLRDQQLGCLKEQLGAAADEAAGREREMRLLEERVRVNAALRQRVEELEEALRGERERERQGREEREEREGRLGELALQVEGLLQERQQLQERGEQLQLQWKEHNQQQQQQQQEQKQGLQLALGGVAAAEGCKQPSRRQRGLGGALAGLALRTLVLGGTAAIAAVSANRCRPAVRIGSTRGEGGGAPWAAADGGEVAAGGGNQVMSLGVDGASVGGC